MKQLQKYALLFGVLIGPAAADAAPAHPATTAAPAICAMIDDIIVADEKELSTLSVTTMLEDSAPRATYESTQMGNAYQEISVNVLLMEAHHCAPHAQPISDGRYLSEAMACRGAQLKCTKDAPECDKSKWTGIPTAGSAGVK